MTEDVRSRRIHLWIIAGLFVLTLVTRVPFRSQVLFHWDSVNFAYAMREFSIVKEQPQPPGYIVYVWFCRLIDVLVGDPQTTMVWISIFASALAVACFFCLGRSMFDTKTGLVAALFLMTSPLFWFYGEIALPHAVDTLLVIVGGWWLYEVMKGQHRYLYPIIVLLAVAGGVRQQTLVFLAPLILFALRKVGWKRFLIAGALGVVVCLMWFVPLMVLSGGINVYSAKMRAFTEQFQTSTSILLGAGWAGVWYNVRRLAKYIPFAWGAALLTALVGAGVKLGRREWPHRWEKEIFLVLWLAPALIYYALIHMGQPGLVLVFLPVLILWGSRGPTWILGDVSQKAFVVLSGILLAFNAGLFCLVPEYPLGEDGLRLWNRDAIASVDNYYQDRFDVIERDYPVSSTAILSSNWHHVEYYLPDYAVIHADAMAGKRTRAADPGDGAEKRLSQRELGLVPSADGQIGIVVFDAELHSFNDTPEVAKTVDLEHGGHLEILELSSEQELYYGKRYGVRDEQQ